jgi:hypothetical protein
MVTPTPGDNPSHPQVPQRHHIKKIKQRKETTTTRHLSMKAGWDEASIDEETNCINSGEIIEKALRGTVLAAANPAAIARAARENRLGSEDVAIVIDALDRQYRSGRRQIDNPTALITTVLKDAAAFPRGHASMNEGDAEAPSRKAEKNVSDEERLIREDEGRAYKEAKARFSALTDKDKERLFARVKAKLPHFLGRSRLAVEALTIDMISKAPGCFNDSEETDKASSVS